MQQIHLQRKSDSGIATSGYLDVFDKTVWTLEDPWQEHKIWGNTRIPAGTYPLALRNEGGMTERYAKRYLGMHKGMIWLQDVPYFEWVYIHVGNTAADTNGCILVGLGRDGDEIYSSRAAYEKIYPAIVAAIESSGCEIVVHDEQG